MLSQAVARFFCIPIWRMEIVFCVFAAAAAVCAVLAMEHPRPRAVPWGTLLSFCFIIGFYCISARRAIYTATVNSRRRQLLFLCLFIYVRTHIHTFIYIYTYKYVYLYIESENACQEYNGRTSQCIRICICLLVYCAGPGTAATNFASKFCIWVPLKQGIQF